MCVGIISSGTENYRLISLCHQYNIPYILLVDTQGWPHQDKDPHETLATIRRLIGYGRRVGCTHFLLSPLYELLFQDDESIRDDIIPLFQHYLAFVYSRSRVGKIGYLGAWAEGQMIYEIHQKQMKNYVLTAKQQHISSFHHPMVYWYKDTSMWHFWSKYFGHRTMLINKAIKFDLGYFKDADVDTIVPWSYEYFAWQRLITQTCNPKRYTFHKWEIITDIFSRLIDSKITSNQHDSQQVNIYTTGDFHLIQDKKREIIAGHGGRYALNYVRIYTDEFMD